MTNHITLTGNLAAPPELRFTQSGKAVLNARIANTPRRRNDRGEWEDAGETLWADVTMWGEDAEATAELIGDRKGRVTVTGRAGTRTFTTRDGEERRSFTITADAIAFHPPKGQARPAPTNDPWATGGSSFPDEIPF